MNDTNKSVPNLTIKAIIGLGNPGPQFTRTRHNIGFLILDALAAECNAHWNTTELLEYTTIEYEGKSILLIKPQTFMNSSGKIIPWLSKKGIKTENLLVIHDELEKPFGSISLKKGGSARGHNGVRSIIEYAGPDFARVRFGIARPEQKSQVGEYVLAPFSENTDHITKAINTALVFIKSLFL